MRELSVSCIMNVLFHQTPKPSNIHQPKQIYIIIIYLLYMQIYIFVLGNYFWKHKLGALVFWIFNFLCDISRVLNRYLINWNKTEWKNASFSHSPSPPSPCAHGHLVMETSSGYPKTAPVPATLIHSVLYFFHVYHPPKEYGICLCLLARIVCTWKLLESSCY